MILFNILEKFVNELVDVFTDIKLFFIDVINSIHTFLNRFMPDDIILAFGILILAFLAIMVFRYVINKR